MKKLITISLILILLLGCRKNESVKSNTVNELDLLCKFVSHNEVIKDSIKKLKGYNQKLILCYYNETAEIGIVTLDIPCLPYQLNKDYIFKNIEGASVLFVNSNKKISSRKPYDNLDNLIAVNIVRIEESNRHCESPYLRFAYCKKDLKKIKCYDNFMEDPKGIESFENRLLKLYPKCE